MKPDELPRIAHDPEAFELALRRREDRGGRRVQALSP